MRSFLIFTFIIFSFISCNDDGGSKQLRFWTDRDLDDETFLLLYANDELLGEFDTSLTEPNCTTEGTIAFDLPVQTSVRITIRDNQDNMIEIASIDVDNASSGINVNTNNSDDDTIIRFENEGGCTLTYLNW